MGPGRCGLVAGGLGLYYSTCTVGQGSHRAVFDALLYSKPKPRVDLKKRKNIKEKPKLFFRIHLYWLK